MAKTVSTVNDIIVEAEPNSTVDNATIIPKDKSIRGNLASQSDSDCYAFSVESIGKIHFTVTPETDNVYTYCWNAQVISPNGTTVLKEGNLSGKEVTEFSVDNTEQGTYYLKISVANGGNPFMNGYSSENYLINYKTECSSHGKLSKWTTTVEPTCKSKGERVQKCELCQTVVVTETVDVLKHKYNKWSVVDEAGFFKIGTKKHTCVLCGSVEEGIIVEKYTVITLVALVLLLIAVIIIRKAKNRKKRSHYSYTSSAYSEKTTYKPSSSHDSSVSGTDSSLYTSYEDEHSSTSSVYIPDPIANDHATVGGMDYIVHYTDAEGYSTGPYVEDAEGYKTKVNEDDIDPGFNYLDM